MELVVEVVGVMVLVEVVVADVCEEVAVVEVVVVDCEEEVVVLDVVVARGLKLATSVKAPETLSVAELLDPLYEPVPVPVQPVNCQPEFAEAVIWTDEAESCQSFPGLTEPPWVGFA